MSKARQGFATGSECESDSNIRFDEMCYLLEKLGFVQRLTSGSHAIFQHKSAFVDLQNVRGMVKACQVRQVREMLTNR